VLSTPFSPEDFRIGPSTVKGAGKGLFTRVPVRAGENLGYYTGKILSDREAQKVRADLRKYLVPVVRDYQILGDTFLRFINHSYKPNARMIYSYRWKTARFAAIRNIKAGSEIFIEYDFAFMKRMKMLEA
jgi:SET domain-containing protein